MLFYLWAKEKLKSLLCDDKLPLRKYESFNLVGKHTWSYSVTRYLKLGEC